MMLIHLGLGCAEVYFYQQRFKVTPVSSLYKLSKKEFWKYCIHNIGIAKCPVSWCNRICTTCHCQLIITNWDRSLCVRRAANEKVSICCTSGGKVIDWATTKSGCTTKLHNYTITQLCQLFYNAKTNQLDRKQQQETGPSFFPHCFTARHSRASFL